MIIFFSLLSGLIFGVGLIISGMANPAKVIGFLDITGPWDPSLVLVMAAAVAVASIAFFFAERRTVSFLGTQMKFPHARHIDRRLIGGGLLFGIGWGIAGFCPGPGLVSLGTGQAKALVFVIAMLVGMVVFELIEKRRKLKVWH